MRLNLGCGDFPLPRAGGWENWDEDRDVRPDVLRHVPPIDLADGTVEEVYAGHLLEHFAYDEGQALLRECHRVLVPGGRLGVVVPHTRLILSHYLRGNNPACEVPAGRWWQMSDLDEVCGLFLYSTCQRSPHRWSYDVTTLHRALGAAGFVHVVPMAHDDARISVAAWWNLGMEAVRP